MKWMLILSIFSLILLSHKSFALEATSAIQNYCLQEFHSQSRQTLAERKLLCSRFKLENECVSEKGRLIPHYEKEGSALNPIRILVFGEIHGDEADAGVLAYQWIERLESLSPKNSWRVIPRLNPDGHHLNTRMNANGIDLNRNFPTKDWDALAISTWKGKEKSNPRRYPGVKAGSEKEIVCAIHQIDVFKPDIIVSVHSPYGLLDFDGKTPKARPVFGLPWRFLGTFPGSLGRYMWVERHIPLLTIELAPSSLKKNRSSFDRLQDFISLLAHPESKLNQK